MPFVPPAYIPQVTYPPYASHPRHPVGTLHYEQDYNNDLTSMKIQIRNILKRNGLAGVRAGFPFHCVPDRHGRELAMSYTPYKFEFREHFHSLEQRSGFRSVTFQYSPPPPRPGSRMHDWSIVVPERQSLHYSHTQRAIAHVQVDPLVMETNFGFLFMTNPLILQEALALSIELGVLITIVPNKKTPPYSPEEILFLRTDVHGPSQVVCTYTP